MVVETGTGGVVPQSLRHLVDAARPDPVAGVSGLRRLAQELLWGLWRLFDQLVHVRHDLVLRLGQQRLEPGDRLAGVALAFA